MAVRPGRVPERTCVGCRRVEARPALVRVAGAPGRGAYVHPRRACLEMALRGGLARSLRRAPTPDERRRVAEMSPSEDK